MIRIICISVLVAGIATSASNVLAQAQPELPVCNHHAPKGDCHIHDRSSYLAMTAAKPDQRTQPHAWWEFQEQSRLARRGGRS